jgi:nitrogen fixation NifU-like protein
MLRIIRRYKYSETILNKFENLKNIGKLDEKNKNVGTGLVGSPACGDVLRIQILVKEGKIIESKYKTFGCGSAIASGEVISDMIKNKTIEEASKISNKEIAEYLKLPPIKLHCSMLAESGIKEAIKDYMKKNK